MNHTGVVTVGQLQHRVCALLKKCQRMHYILIWRQNVGHTLQIYETCVIDGNVCRQLVKLIIRTRSVPFMPSQNKERSYSGSFKTTVCSHFLRFKLKLLFLCRTSHRKQDVGVLLDWRVMGKWGHLLLVLLMQQCDWSQESKTKVVLWCDRC